MHGCEALACAEKGCGHTIHLHHDVVARYREDHSTFYCPAGHSNYFPAKKKTEASELRRKLAQAEEVRDRFRQYWHDALEKADEWKRIACTCPFGCGFSVKRKWKRESVQMSLVDHFCKEHGAEFYVPPVEELRGSPSIRQVTRA